jgi:hypothetical protein
MRVDYRKFRGSLLAASFLILVFSFENCSQVGEVSKAPQASTASVEAGSYPGEPSLTDGVKEIPTSETTITTNLNTGIEFTLNSPPDSTSDGIELDPKSLISQSGVIGIKAGSSMVLKYLPKIGFRGRETLTILGTDRFGKPIKFMLTLVVANILQDLKPALAIRGMGCIQCHAKVNSNIITDFGAGSDYYFNGNKGGDWWKSGGIYGDHGGSFSSMDLASDTSVYLPKTALPSTIATLTGLVSLADYVKSRFQKSGNSGTKNSKIIEKNRIYIGAPSSWDITKSFSLKESTRIVYFKNAEKSDSLVGLKDQGTYFKNDGILTCDGDLALRGPVYFNNLEINSVNGCRIYVIGSVFIFGPVTHTNSSEFRNLQITSTRSISLGLGLTKKNEAFCDPASGYATTPASFNESSLVTRYRTFWTVPGYATRGQSDPILNGDLIVDEAKLIESKESLIFYDATCRPEGRNVSFSRILLNAPAIQSRYQGDIIGTVIAEYSVMSLGMFKFQYDSVFDKVPILPFLRQNVYLEIADE